MQDPQCEEVVDHALPPADKWVGGEITPDYNENDQGKWMKTKSQLTGTPG